jgi:hypothetical protein
MSAGTKIMVQNAQITVQCDFHAPDTAGGDMAQIVSTALRDEYGVDFFAALAPPLNGIIPLYADDPKQVPFTNAEQQWEWRWIVEAQLEVNQAVSVLQSYADSITIDVVDVSATYPLS